MKKKEQNLKKRKALARCTRRFELYVVFFIYFFIFSLFKLEVPQYTCTGVGIDNLLLIQTQDNLFKLLYSKNTNLV